jgi:hypothetical protein
MMVFVQRIIMYILRYFFLKFLISYLEKLLKWVLDRIGKRRF